MADSKSLDGQMLVEAIREGGGDAALERVRALIEDGADLGARDSQELTPLETAGTYHAWATMDALLDAGAPAEHCDGALFDALMTTALHGPRRLVERLLHHGFAWEGLLEQKNRGRSINDHVLLRPCSSEVSEVLIFEDLLGRKDHRRLNWLMELGAGRIIDTFDPDIGTNALGFRVRDRDIDGARWLLDSGAWIDPVTTFDLNFLPIDRAVMNHDFAMVALLVERGVNPNIRNWMNCNAVDRAKHSAKKREHADAQAIYDIVLAASPKFPMID